MHGPTTTGIILIVIVALLLFGPNKLPELGRAFGKTLREFKNGAKDIINDEEPKKQARREIPADEVTVQDTATEEETKPQNNRRLPD